MHPSFSSSPRLGLRPLERRPLKGKVLPVVLLACFLSPLLHADQEGEFKYSRDGSSITITGFTGKRAVVTVPDKIAGLPVTTIGSRAFADHEELTSVTLPSGVTTIGNHAFMHCPLTHILLPRSLKVLGENVFSGCNLTNIIIPPTVTNIGDFCFAVNEGLTGAIFLGNRPTIGSYPFYKAAPNFSIQFFKGSTGSTGMTGISWHHWTHCRINKGVKIVDPANELFEWSIKDGKAIKAKFVKLDGEAVVIRTEDGTEKSMPFTSLSPDSGALAKALSEVK